MPPLEGFRSTGSASTHGFSAVGQTMPALTGLGGSVQEPRSGVCFLAQGASPGFQGPHPAFATPLPQERERGKGRGRVLLPTALEGVKKSTTPFVEAAFRRAVL
jgi:hypothetical protein